MIDENEVLANYKRCKAEIEKVCAECGRRPDDITIVGASKTMPLERVRFVAENTGISVFGENRVQELCEKFSPDLEWHFIGQLQTNKVKYIIDKVTLIHSLDRIQLAAEIDRQAKKRGVTADCLLEVNLAGEVSKGGAAPDELISFAKSLENFENIRIKGLMSVLPNADSDILERFYLQLRQLYVKLKDTKLRNGDICRLSAGMSNDYRLAVKYGANIVRLGRAVFGER